VRLDGATIFREPFANAAASQTRSYVPSLGNELARHVDLGFSGPGATLATSNVTDSAYNLGNEAAFNNIAHTGATAIFTFVIKGDGIQSLADESWAFDNLSGLGGLVGAARRRRAV
jgi:hypothetical protein